MLCVLLLAGCGNNTAPEISGAVKTQQALEKINALGYSTPDDNYRTWYEVFVYSFCDSNGDGIGDLRGLQSKLDYLQELGITGIWLMPVHPSTTYHKYNVSDYYAIDPSYGTLADMEALLADCQKRNIRVILDLVVNHTGYDHPWFTAAADYLKALPAGEEPDREACKYLDYYFFSREAGDGMRQLNGTDFYYEAMFSPDMPDLNLDEQRRCRLPAGCSQGVFLRPCEQKCGSSFLAAKGRYKHQKGCLSGGRGLGHLCQCHRIL